MNLRVDGANTRHRETGRQTGNMTSLDTDRIRMNKERIVSREYSWPPCTEINKVVSSSLARNGAGTYERKSGE
jgi:hypothetical protein